MGKGEGSRPFALDTEGEEAYMSDICPVCGNPIGAREVLCPSCGYRLQGTTQRFMPVTLGDEALVSSPKAAESAALRVVRGPQAGVTFALEGDSLSVGRSPQCDIFLNDMTVSRRHATIKRVDAGYLIVDEHSFNGVWVNNENVESHLLRAGDIVQVGAFCLLYQEE